MSLTQCMSGSMLLVSFGKSLPEEGTLARGNFLYDAMSFRSTTCARHWNVSIACDFSWGVVSCGWFGTKRNDMIFSALQWLIKKMHRVTRTPCRITVGLSGNVLSWIWKARDVAYQDVLEEVDLIWESKVLLWPIAT